MLPLLCEEGNTALTEMAEDFNAIVAREEGEDNKAGSLPSLSTEDLHGEIDRTSAPGEGPPRDGGGQDVGSPGCHGSLRSSEKGPAAPA